jgi:Kef-type K+ transport system membrane component KefB
MNTLVLLHAGILLVTGLLFGKIAKFFRFPNVTGYLVGGLLIGPSVLNLLKEDQLASLQVVSMVALAFIAFSIGNEMKVSYFKRAGTKAIVIAILEGLMGTIGVFVATIVYFLIRGNFTLTDVRFALVLSAIAAATAPAATMMVVRQYKAKGPLTETLLSVVAIDDSVAIILFGVLVAVSNMLGNVGTQSIFLQILEPFYEIFVSIAVGAAVGFVLLLGCKWFTGRGNRISLVVALLFLLIFVVNWLGGSTLLAAMAMGFLFVNLSPVYEDINNLTYFVTPPIFMMFFVLSGAELNLSILTMVGAIGVIYVLSRVAGKIFGAWWGAKLTKAEPIVAKYLGFALVPQAGVAIGLSLVATQVLSPEMGSQIRVVILAATLIYELTGPIITKITLQKAGEISMEPIGKMNSAQAD